ncbi:hypothetical protein GALMADRAFT_155191 [Galerina marginata CBS 339.88]|uniref:Beta-glucuronidase C-terminal domain-containing protein n=1 Tax=Galerina marginata (strain CBS 339.88) TaxID=685588 RepID=A0A067TE79_GALM3|nr:hypothetical protein GALMADRAFT_155191 [Galerina marginata CBS 339.88]
MSSFSFLQKLIFLSVFVRHALCISVSVPVVAPSTAPTLSQSLVSLSIEQDRWTDYAGTTTQNQFFFNTLDNLRLLTGEPPRVRIGADSEDRTNFNRNVQFSEAIFPAPNPTTPYPEASNVTVGDGYFQAAQFLPPNTRVIWGLNFGQNNITAGFLETKSILKAFGSPSFKRAGITLEAIEIGNEPDIYIFNGHRAATYSSTDYTQEWTAYAKNITATAQLSSSSKTKFWVGALGGSSGSTTGFSPQAVYSEGILSSVPGSLISTFSQHHYSGTFCSGSGGLLQDLMTKSTIRGNLTGFTPDIVATHAKGLDYVLGETNSYSCHGAPGVSNTAGAALWTLDYALFAPQIGISRVYFHVGIGYKYSLMQPVTLTRSPLDGTTLATPLAPHIQPQYYGAIVAAEAIGNKGNTRAVELNIDNIRIAGYAFFDGTKLARVLLINSQAFLSTDTSPRTSIHVDLGISGKGAPIKMTVKRLSIPRADATAGVTWGGQTFETSTGRPSGKVQVQTANVAAGVDVQATEAVLLTFL